MKPLEPLFQKLLSRKIPTTFSKGVSRGFKGFQNTAVTTLVDGKPAQPGIFKKAPMEIKKHPKVTADDVATALNRANQLAAEEGFGVTDVVLMRIALELERGNNLASTAIERTDENARVISDRLGDIGYAVSA